MNNGAVNNVKEEISNIKQSKHNIEVSINKFLINQNKKDALEALKKILFFDTSLILDLEQSQIEQIYTIINDYKISALALYSHSTISNKVTDELNNSIIQSSKGILNNKYINPRKDAILSQTLLEEERNKKIQNTLKLITSTLNTNDKYATLISQIIKDESIFKIIGTAVEYIMLYRQAITQKEENNSNNHIDIYSSFIKRFREDMIKFAENKENKELEENYIESAKNIIKKLSIFSNDKTQNNIENISMTAEELKILQEKFRKLEIKTDEQNFLAYIKEALQQLNDAKELFERAKLAESLINDEVQELKKAKEGHIAYTLSDKLNEKVSKCKEDVRTQFILFILSIIGIVFINCTMLGLSDKLIQENHFWELLTMKILFNLPLVLLIFFFLNQFVKAKRLHEEFDYKVIMAQTLMNNYNRLKDDFTQNQDKLLDLLKAPIEKIFDNPVHSVYGDKSGDKGLGIDQLEKIISIASKLKDKKD